MDLEYKVENGWKNIEPEKKKAIMAFGEDYKCFMNYARTEREFCAALRDEAIKSGFEDLDGVLAEGRALVPGMKVYRCIRGKSLALSVIGKMSPAVGLNMIGSHIDSPRIDFKPTPLYEDHELVYAKTHYYGGIKKYHWVATPLTIRGIVFKKDGTSINISIGDKEGDPVFTITDLLPHMATDQMQKKASEFITGEGLNILLGSTPYSDKKDGDTKDLSKYNILKYLNDHYGISEPDLISAELEILPANKASDIGFDRAMVGAYGQDDRVCAYTSFRAIVDMAETPDRTAVCFFSDKEEVGSMGNTGAQSTILENFVGEICSAYEQTNSFLGVRRCLSRSVMLSADVSGAFDPNYPDTVDRRNIAYMSKGLCFTKYTGSRGKSGASDASPELIAFLAGILEKEDISWQTGELGRVDLGGGGTIAQYMANLGIEVIDCGVPVFSMHSPFEITSKYDIYSAYAAYKCFYTSNIDGESGNG